MQVCQLNQMEASALERDGVLPECRQHDHLRKTLARHLVGSGEARYVGGKKRAIVIIRYETRKLAKNDLIATGSGYDRAVLANDDLAPGIAMSGAFPTRQLLHGGCKTP